MFRRGGARSGRDLNCQSAVARGSSVAVQARAWIAFMVVGLGWVRGQRLLVALCVVEGTLTLVWYSTLTLLFN